MNKKPCDFGVYICFNVTTNALAICGYCARTKQFLNFTDREAGAFDATHWWLKPERDGDLFKEVESDTNKSNQ